MEQKKMSAFEELSALNLNGRTEKRRDALGHELTYLSWPWAVNEMTKRYPDWEYEIVKTNDLPYVFDPDTGYMVTTRVTADGLTREMWLPVMDGANRAMKAKPYTISTKRGDITVQAATMFDINKAIMRCLVKNLAMFGLGLYLYAGEDVPEEDAQPKQEEPVQDDADVLGKLRGQILDLVGGDVERVNAFLAKAIKGAPKLEDLNVGQLEAIRDIIAKRMKKEASDDQDVR